MAVVVFRSFYGSSEPGTTSHDGCNPVESVAPPFHFILPFEWLPAPTSTPETGTHDAERLEPLYHVILLDDDDHTYDYVIEMLMALFAHSREAALAMASEVDKSGRVVVDTTTRERAELKQEQIHAYGKDWRIPRCAGSMSADIEEAGG